MIGSAKPGIGISFTLVLLAVGFFAGCSGGDGGVSPVNPPSPPGQVAVTVTPAAASISTRQLQQFTATVVNTSNPAVTWKVDGIQGGNATVGVISAGGLYTPSSSAATRTITATSVADPTKSGSATVTVRL